MQVASTRPIPFAEDSVIFELRDGRVSNHYLKLITIFHFLIENPSNVSLIQLLLDRFQTLYIDIHFIQIEMDLNTKLCDIIQER